MDQGTQLTVMAGPTVPVPLPPPIAQRLLAVNIKETDGSRSAYTLTFDASRSGPAELMGTPVTSFAGLQSGSRVSIVLTVNAMPQVLADGFITRVEHRPGTGPGTSQMVVTAEDASWLLDREEVTRELPMDDYPQVQMILAGYAAQGIVPKPIQPLRIDPSLPIERVPQQRATDLAHLTTLARRHGYVTYALPGPLPGMSTLYWGPTIRVGVPQKAITIGQVPSTNVTGDVTFTLDAHGPVQIRGRDRDRRTGAEMPIQTLPPTRVPLAALPLALVRSADTRVRLTRESGSSVLGTLARAQAEVDLAADAVTASGTLDGIRYGGALHPRSLVGMRGAGWVHDGIWYVRSVEHTLAQGTWTQAFVLARDGIGSTVLNVIP